MKICTTSLAAASAIGMAAVLAATPAHAVLPVASAVIGNGNIFLGVNSDGSLNTNTGVGPTGRTGIGLFDGRTAFEATYDGCTCEGWGVSATIGGSAYSVYANTAVDGGLQSSGGTASVAGFSAPNTFSATSVVLLSDATGNLLRVAQSFAPSISTDLYQVNVAITNLGTSALTDLVYRRVMDWDIEPTPFSEYVTIGGVRNASGILHPNILFSSDNGFASGNPLSGPSSILSGTSLVNFADSGPADHGALFDFQFGGLAAGDTRSFNIFYGASLSETNAFNALNMVGAEIYSFGQSSDSPGGFPVGDPLDTGSARSTFIFAFDIDNDGTSPTNPLLPLFIDANGGFHFVATASPGETVWIDPLVATGYDYVTTGALITAATFAPGLVDANGYEIYALSGGILGGLLGTVAAGGTFNFAGAGVSAFALRDIDVGLGLDPSNPTAFVTGLTFAVSGPTAIDITQTPVTTFVPDSAVPEPATWAMMLAGFGLMGASLRRRKQQVRVRFAI